MGTSGFQSSSASCCSACVAASTASPLKSPAPLRPLLPAGASWLGDVAAASGEAAILVLALAEGRRVLGLTAATTPFVACGSAAIAASLRNSTQLSSMQGQCCNGEARWTTSCEAVIAQHRRAVTPTLTRTSCLISTENPNEHQDTNSKRAPYRLTLPLASCAGLVPLTPAISTSPLALGPATPLTPCAAAAASAAALRWATAATTGA